jgi:hypothetical protein
MKTFKCSNCGQITFFENVVCEHCGMPLGYIPEIRAMVAFQPDSDLFWSPVNSALAEAYRPCRNYVSLHICNWMVAESDQSVWCRSCRFTEMIPALSVPEHLQRWFLLEAAKRRLIYSLMQIGLPIPDRDRDPARGLRFKFLADTPQEQVLTGHLDGVITLNIDEADDATRELKRTRMHESYRTLLGHLRHEVGHFYWLHLIAESPWLEGFRTLFGDERQDYKQSLDQYYATQSSSDWTAEFISEYASAHPWEDWAESWAHYLHIVDALDTAANWHARTNRAQPSSPFPEASAPLTIEAFEAALTQDWLPLALFLNSMNRSLGQKDSYPFVIPDAVIRKLCFIHEVVLAARGASPDARGY